MLDKIQKSLQITEPPERQQSPLLINPQAKKISKVMQQHSSKGNKK